ncbi:MAG: hypothetical protein LWW91_11495, partial [Bacteroidales bacterium]|nr:hypothetical protein [Bacteroidales bacterium]
MPYRRLPNTDQARIRALRAALKMEERVGFNNHILSFKIVLDAKNFLSQYEAQQAIYHQSLENQVNANKKYQRMISNARMYISHFIQVFNMAVVRGEINTEQAVLEWGKKIIEGEALRVGQGGLPIYNPTIAKVQVHYDVFREYKASQKMYQQTTSRKWEEMIALRKQGDELIVQLWNEIEEHFKNLKPYARLMKCVEYGIIYYYRKGE